MGRLSTLVHAALCHAKRVNKLVICFCYSPGTTQLQEGDESAEHSMEDSGRGGPDGDLEDDIEMGEEGEEVEDGDEEGYDGDPAEGNNWGTMPSAVKSGKVSA